MANAELKDFLRTRRARLTPEEVGLPDVGRRRTPGLRREEVAVLAGVGVSWYTWLEQGRDIKASESVLDAVSRALRLDDTEHEHLYRLAGLVPPHRNGNVPLDRLQRIVDSWLPSPAYAIDRYWNVQVSNAAARAVFGLGDQAPNCLIMFFTNEAARARYPHADELAGELVGQFREQAARFPDDDRFAALARELSTRSPEFAHLWRRHDVLAPTAAPKEYLHPEAGRMLFERSVLTLPECRQTRIMLYVPDHASQIRLSRLLVRSPAAA